MDADPVELRVLGCLIEKQRTTPDQYPLSLNSLRLACNQSTNRDPVVEYDEATIRRALDRLGRRGWTRLASGPGSRAAKFRHLFDEALRLDDEEISLLAVLMLRGPQTPGELKQRTERLHRFEGLDEIEAVLERLGERELAEPAAAAARAEGGALHPAARRGCDPRARAVLRRAGARRGRRRPAGRAGGGGRRAPRRGRRAPVGAGFAPLRERLHRQEREDSAGPEARVRLSGWPTPRHG